MKVAIENLTHNQTLSNLSICININIMKQKRLRIVSLFFEKIGMILGKILKFTPSWLKKNIVIMLGKFLSFSRGRIHSLLYLISDKIVKHMCSAENKEVFLVKNLFKDLKIRLDVSKKTQRILYLQKLYEPYIYNYLVKNLREGGVFIDIGANVGFYALLGAKLVGKNGKVYAFEPENKNFSDLIANIKLNGLRNVACINKAVAKDSKKSKLFINPLNDGGGSLIKFNLYSDDKEKWSFEKIKGHFPKTKLEQNIETISLDQFLMDEKIKKPIDMIKIDVEGNELNTLMGMQKLLESENAPEIICEVSRSGNEIFNILNRYNYKIYTLNEKGEVSCYDKNDDYLKGKNFLFSKNHH